MKYLFGFLCILFLMSSCSKDENRVPGICYCKFYKGDPQQYDLTALSRQAQIDQCKVHDNNASKFGGDCELE